MRRGGRDRVSCRIWEGGIEGKEGKWVKWEGQRVGGSYILGGGDGR